jgi:hypothetical protein
MASLCAYAPDQPRARSSDSVQPQTALKRCTRQVQSVTALTQRWRTPPLLLRCARWQGGKGRADPRPSLWVDPTTGSGSGFGRHPLRSFGTLPPLVANLDMTCLCSHTFIGLTTPSAGASEGQTSRRQRCAQRKSVQAMRTNQTRKPYQDAPASTEAPMVMVYGF